MKEAGKEHKPKLHFHFVRSSAFRVVYAEGAFGGVSPKGAIRMAFFNERQPIPDEVVHEAVEATGGFAIGTEIPGSRVGKAGIVRELEVDVVMNVETAVAVHAWLGKKIEELKNIKDAQAGRQQAKPDESC